MAKIAQRRTEHYVEVSMTRKKTAKDFIGKRILIRVKNTRKGGEFYTFFEEYTIRDKAMATRIANSVNIINRKVDAMRS